MRAFLNRVFGKSTPAAFHSKFGGLWIDRADAPGELARRHARGAIDAELTARIAAFMRDGYVIIPGAVPVELTDRLASLINGAYAMGDARLRYHTDGAVHHVLDAPTDPRGKRIVESHGVLAESRDVLAAPKLVAFLTAIFEETPVLTQTLIFQTGSEQGFHQDPAFVVYDQPLKMAAAWVALEDVKPGSGELKYVVNSHRLPDYVFSTGRRDSHDAKPGEVQDNAAWLLAEIQRRALKHQTFLPRKGDALIWHADLAHGGSPITDPASTRQSLVGHFCPASVLPKYELAPKRGQHGPLLYSSYLYDAAAG